MGYKIARRGVSEFCVLNAASGELIHCHASRPEAEAQIAALMLAEERARRIQAAASGAPGPIRGHALETGAGFSESTPQEREQMSLDSFGDPEKRLYPIVDASDVADAAALIGKADNPDAVRKRIIAIAKRKGFPIPEAWESGPDNDHDADDRAQHSAHRLLDAARATLDAAQMALTDSPGGDYGHAPPGQPWQKSMPTGDIRGTFQPTSADAETGSHPPPDPREEWADAVNGKWALGTEADVNTAYRAFQQPETRAGYTERELADIDARIRRAAERLGQSVITQERQPRMETKVKLAEFALTGETWEDGDMIYRAGKLFEAGDYPDKGFSMTPDELRAAASHFRGAVAIDIEHIPTVLDGKIGQLLAVDVTPDGRELLGVTAMPKWLDQALGDGERKVSATWDRATKELVGLGLVRNPRVTDACLLSAFSAAAPPDPNTVSLARPRQSTPHGQAAMQQLHDMAAQHGAVCRSANAAFTSRHESSALQGIHDLAAASGASCPLWNRGDAADPAGHGGSPFPPETREPSNRGSSAFPSAPGAGMPAAARKPWDRGSSFFPAAFAKLTAPFRRRTEEPVNVKDQFLALLNQIEDGGAGGSEPPPEGAAPPAETAPATLSHPALAVLAAQAKEMQAERDQFRAYFEEERERRNSAEAENWVAEQIRSGRAIPAERPALLAVYAQSMRDDQAGEAKVTFGADREGKPLIGSRVEALKGLFAQRPPHQMMRELAPGEAAPILHDMRVLYGQSADEAGRNQPPSPERVAALLKMAGGVGTDMADEMKRAAPAANGRN